MGITPPPYLLLAPLISNVLFLKIIAVILNAIKINYRYLLGFNNLI